MLAAVDAAATADEKGDRLEELMVYVLAHARGVSLYDKRILDGLRAHELDLVFWNEVPRSELYFLEALFIVECKASAAPVGSDEVGWFIRKLQDRGAHFGILVALNGITGDGNKSAGSEVQLALIRDKIKILLIDRQELEALRNTAELAALLQRKFLQLVVRRTNEDGN
jgi:hypothetical protein